MMERTYLVPDPRPWLRDCLASPSAMDAYGRGARYRELRLARRGKDADDGWRDLTDAERAPWVEKARASFKASLAAGLPAHEVTVTP